MILMSIVAQSIMQALKGRRQSTKLSQKPTTYMEQATAFARENMRPIDPPNSGPNDLEII